MGMHPPINPIRSRWIRPAPGPLWTHLLEVPLLDQKELDLGHVISYNQSQHSEKRVSAAVETTFQNLSINWLPGIGL